MKFVKFFSIAMMLTLCAGFVSCSDDDDDESNEQLLIGTWMREDGSEKWIFESDGKFEWWWYSNSREEWELDTDEGTWHMEGNVIVLYGDDEYYQIQELTKEKLVVMDVEYDHERDIETFYRI